MQPTNPLIRVAIVAFAPIGVNAGVAFAFFAMACCMGPIFSMCCKKFGAVLAAIAHAIAVIVLIVMWEVMFFLEGWSFPKMLIGMIASLAIQRFIYKLIIALTLTREFRTDSSNIAWWTGKWYGMGWMGFSQPGREFLCKITELGYFSSDFVLGHLLLFFMLPPLLIPYIDTFHSVMLFWLRPSRQIRPPIYSLKQSKLRRRRTIRYAILYFTLFVLFIVLIVAPMVAGKFLDIAKINIPMNLVQPTNLKNNDTTDQTTGTILGTAAATAAASGDSAASSAAARRFAHFMY